jgi:hypothetical protein
MVTVSVTSTHASSISSLARTLGPAEAGAISKNGTAARKNLDNMLKYKPAVDGGKDCNRNEQKLGHARDQRMVLYTGPLVRVSVLSGPARTPM